MKKLINKALYLYLGISTCLLFYKYDTHIDFDKIARFLYFTKDNALIAFLILCLFTTIKTVKKKALMFATLAYTSSLMIYEYLLINFDKGLYASMVREPVFSIILAIIPISFYQIYILYQEINGKFKRSGKCSSRIKKLYRRVKGFIQKNSIFSNYKNSSSSDI